MKQQTQAPPPRFHSSTPVFPSYNKLRPTPSHLPRDDNSWWNSDDSHIMPIERHEYFSPDHMIRWLKDAAYSFKHTVCPFEHPYIDEWINTYNSHSGIANPHDHMFIISWNYFHHYFPSRVPNPIVSYNPTQYYLQVSTPSLNGFSIPPPTRPTSNQNISTPSPTFSKCTLPSLTLTQRIQTTSATPSNYSPICEPSKPPSTSSDHVLHHPPATSATRLTESHQTPSIKTTSSSCSLQQSIDHPPQISLSSRLTNILQSSQTNIPTIGTTQPPSINPSSISCQSTIQPNPLTTPSQPQHPLTPSTFISTLSNLDKKITFVMRDFLSSQSMLKQHNVGLPLLVQWLELNGWSRITYNFDEFFLIGDAPMQNASAGPILVAFILYCHERGLNVRNVVNSLQNAFKSRRDTSIFTLPMVQAAISKCAPGSERIFAKWRTQQVAQSKQRAPGTWPMWIRLAFAKYDFNAPIDESSAHCVKYWLTLTVCVISYLTPVARISNLVRTGSIKAATRATVIYKNIYEDLEIPFAWEEFFQGFKTKHTILVGALELYFLDPSTNTLIGILAHEYLASPHKDSTPYQIIFYFFTGKTNQHGKDYILVAFQANRSKAELFLTLLIMKSLKACRHTHPDQNLFSYTSFKNNSERTDLTSSEVNSTMTHIFKVTEKIEGAFSWKSTKIGSVSYVLSQSTALANAFRRAQSTAGHSSLSSTLHYLQMKPHLNFDLLDNQSDLVLNEFNILPSAIVPKHSYNQYDFLTSIHDIANEHGQTINNPIPINKYGHRIVRPDPCVSILPITDLPASKSSLTLTNSVTKLSPLAATTDRWHSMGSILQNAQAFEQNHNDSDSTSFHSNEMTRTEKKLSEHIRSTLYSINHDPRLRSFDSEASNSTISEALASPLPPKRKRKLSKKASESDNPNLPSDLPSPSILTSAPLPYITDNPNSKRKTARKKQSLSGTKPAKDAGGGSL